MDFLVLLGVASSVGLFGFFFGYERIGRGLSAVFTMVFLFLAAGISAVGETEATTVAKQFTFNIVVFNAFVLGYTIGYPWKRPWWKKTAAATALVILILLIYQAFILI